MIATIKKNGRLNIKAENHLDQYALEKWAIDFDNGQGTVELSLENFIDFENDIDNG